MENDTLKEKITRLEKENEKLKKELTEMKYRRFKWKCRFDKLHQEFIDDGVEHMIFMASQLSKRDT